MKKRKVFYLKAQTNKKGIKNIFRYSIVLLISSISAYSQNFPIPAIGAEWNNAESDGTSYYANRIVSIGDTIIDSRVFSKLYETWNTVYFQIGACAFEYSSGPHQTNEYRGAIKTDEDQRVYYVYPYEDTSRLIYDFSVDIGDSILIDGYDSKYYATVLDIDSLIINNAPRKRITLKGIYGFQDEWVEGIGSLSGLFATFRLPWEKYSSELTCYQESGSRVYPDISSCDRCNIVTEILAEAFSSVISIYPNPISESSIIEWPRNIKAKELNIYNVSGRIIYSHQVNSVEYLSINRNDLEKGVLLLELIGGKQNLYRTKLIVL